MQFFYCIEYTLTVQGWSDFAASLCRPLLITILRPRFSRTCQTDSNCPTPLNIHQWRTIQSRVKTPSLQPNLHVRLSHLNIDYLLTFYTILWEHFVLRVYCTYLLTYHLPFFSVCSWPLYHFSPPVDIHKCFRIWLVKGWSDIVRISSLGNISSQLLCHHLPSSNARRYCAFVRLQLSPINQGCMHQIV